MGMKSADAKLVQTAILSAAKELEAKKKAELPQAADPQDTDELKEAI